MLSAVKGGNRLDSFGLLLLVYTINREKRQSGEKRRVLCVLFVFYTVPFLRFVSCPVNCLTV